MSTLEILQRAIRAVFGEWTALHLAVENEWGGHDTREKALALLQRVLDGLSGAAPVYRDELEPVLEAALLDEFNVEAEDESPRQVAELLCKMHAEALAGGTATAAAVLAFLDRLNRALAPPRPRRPQPRAPPRRPWRRRPPSRPPAIRRSTSWRARRTSRPAPPT